MKYHKLPKTIESNYKTMSQEVLRSYFGEIDRFVDHVFDLATGCMEGRTAIVYISVHLTSFIKLNTFYKGQYVGLGSVIWKIVAVETSFKLIDPPTSFPILKLERVEYYAPAQTP